MKVRHLVEPASVGMAHAEPDVRLLWANDKFLSFASRSSVLHGTIDSIHEVFLGDDQQPAQEVRTRISTAENYVFAELLFKQLFILRSR